ncbi:Glucose-6-phosphate 1-dehydrogenase [Nymphon striatum]|nr:Glucose-6-phosphate 1-dehydrogenase [Nymphon striatum]
MVSRVIPVDPFDLVIFGGTGDLSRRKILPGLFRRFCAGQMPKDARIIGAARSDLDDAGYRKLVADAILEFGGGHDSRRKAGLWWKSRLVADLASAKELNGTLAQHFAEDQIYRIDHYLGKETVQNLMAIRFGNMLFEPLWNSQYVDHIQITVAETVGVGGRGGYYDKSGAMRDMVQNHLMQLLCLIAMEPPAKFDPDAVRDEKLKVIRALEPVAPHHIARGQYEAGRGEDGKPQPSYREHAENPRSKTESFVALKTHISNWRWAGTPFYMRTGKRLKARASEIAVVFKETPHSIFDDDAGGHRNVLIIRLQPNEGITLGVTIKEPGPGGMRLVDVPLDMSFAEALGPEAEGVPDAYERLIMDVIRGNQTLFMRGDEVEAAWSWADPIIEGWQARGEVPKPYDSGSSGPDDALALMHRDGRKWREIKP